MWRVAGLSLRPGVRSKAYTKFQYNQWIAPFKTLNLLSNKIASAQSNSCSILRGRSSRTTQIWTFNLNWLSTRSGNRVGLIVFPNFQSQLQFNYSKSKQNKRFGFQMIKGVPRVSGFIFNSVSGPITRPAHSRKRPVWRDPCGFVRGSRGPRAEPACVWFWAN